MFAFPSPARADPTSECNDGPAPMWDEFLCHGGQEHCDGQDSTASGDNSIAIG